MDTHPPPLDHSLGQAQAEATLGRNTAASVSPVLHLSAHLLSLISSDSPTHLPCLHSPLCSAYPLKSTAFHIQLLLRYCSRPAAPAPHPT